jgi:hypothetical protein
VVAGILQLFAIFFVPAFIFWGWVLFTSLLLAFRPAERMHEAAVPSER